MAATTARREHRWSFYSAGGVNQVRLDEGADLFELEHLDQKLWVALSCPVKGLEFDGRTLELLDADGDGHVRPPEILAAVRWLRQVLKSGDSLVGGRDGVALRDLRDDTDEGRAAAASARRILAMLGKADAEVVTVGDAIASNDMLAKEEWNGDGIVPADVLKDEHARKVAEELVACLGGLADRSGKNGFDPALLERFYAECKAFDAWVKAGEADAKSSRPFGADTAAACAALETVRAKVDDFFGRCRLAAYDPRALTAMNREEKAYIEAAVKDLSFEAHEVAHFPLALIEPGKALPLAAGVNPAWADALAKFRALCAKGAETLSEAEWSALRAKADAYAAWQASKAGESVEQLGIERVRKVLAGKERPALQQAIDEDLAVAAEIAGISQVEQLTRFHRDFWRLLNNYVSFGDFYARRGAIFQAGTLHLDGRALDLCFHVNDPGKHATLAAMAKVFLAYVDCTRPGGEKMTVACAFTAGDSDNLFVGRNGIFYDRQGRDWDATIAKIVDNPISVRQAFWSPYKKLMRFIEQSAAKRAAAADEAATSKLQAGAESAGAGAKSGEVKMSKFDVGVVAALGVAVGGITAALAGFLNAFFSLGVWIPLGLIGLMLAISGPAMIIAWLKLRQRNLGPILDANGWAVNTLTKINLPLGGSLTALPKLPAGARRSLVDPYAPKKSPLPRIAAAMIVLAATGYGLYRFNLLNRWFPDFVPAYVSTSFEGPTEVVEGVADVELMLGSGAEAVTVTLVGKDRAFSVPVVAHRFKVATGELVAGDRLTITDPKTGRSHAISVTPKP